MLIAFVLTGAPAFTAGAACKLGMLAELPVTMQDMGPVVTAQINGADAPFLIDSGAFFSIISAASASQYHLHSETTPNSFYVRGVGGSAADVDVTHVKVFTFAGVPLRNVDFLVGGSEVGSSAAGVIGQNVLRVGDVEYDLARGVIRMMRAEDCSHAVLAYWAKADQPYSMVTIEPTTVHAPHAIGTAYLNGTKLRVMFDTGAGRSMLNRKAAERAGVKLDGVPPNGSTSGFGRRKFDVWTASFSSFKIGDEEIKNARLLVSNAEDEDFDMLIGADFFLSHRVYVANGLHRLYFTYNGGRVFNLTTTARSASEGTPAPKATAGEGQPPAPGASSAAGAQAPMPAAPSGAQTPPAVPGDTPAQAGHGDQQASAPANEPLTADAFGRRGAAFAARQDFTHAIADLTRACELAPSEPNYFYERGLAQEQDRQPQQALSDFDEAIRLKADHVPALMARAEFYEWQRNNDAAIADLGAVDKAAAKEADVRLRLGQAYRRIWLFPIAVAQFDLWIGAHGSDSRLPDALTERCWSRAIAGVELDLALADCNTGLKQAPKVSSVRARALAGRALIALRRGNSAQSIADYNAALALTPKDAWALYGRGLAELRMGKTDGAQSDMAAATAVFAGIDGVFKRYGMAP